MNEQHPIIIAINKSKMTNNHRLQTFELLDEFEKSPQLELKYIKEKGLVTSLCWLQFNQLAIITHIEEPNGKAKRIYYALKEEMKT